MTTLLRQIRKGRWLERSDLGWLKPGELIADPLGDLATTGGSLSVFEVPDDGENQRVITALAANKLNPSSFDYVLFDDSWLTSNGFAISQSQGKTPDGVVNGLHYDVIHLSATSLVKMAHIVSAGRLCRVQTKRVKEWIKSAIDNGDLDTSKMQANMLDSLQS